MNNQSEEARLDALEAAGVEVCRLRCDTCTRKVCTGAEKLAEEAGEAGDRRSWAVGKRMKIGGESGRIIAGASQDASRAVAQRISDNGDRVSALIAAAVAVTGLLGFENTLRMSFPLTGTKVRVRTVCEILPDIEVEAEREIDIGGMCKLEEAAHG